jgi:hypothetical protein
MAISAIFSPLGFETVEAQEVRKKLSALKSQCPTKLKYQLLALKAH